MLFSSSCPWSTAASATVPRIRSPSAPTQRRTPSACSAVRSSACRLSGGAVGSMSSRWACRNAASRGSPKSARVMCTGSVWRGRVAAASRLYRHRPPRARTTKVCQRVSMTRTLDVDYLVVGAGAMGMGFADALVDHSDARVAIVDRRHGAGGHWLEDYPFVRLHQSSTFYGVASTVLGGQVQDQGPEAGLHVRASQPEIVDYYAHAVERLRRTGRVEVLTGATCRPHGRLAHLRADVGGAGVVPPGQRPLPRAEHPGRVVGAVLGGRRRSRRDGQRGGARSRRPRASTSSSARARRPPTPACGCSARGSTPTRSAGCGPVTRGCSTGR